MATAFPTGELVITPNAQSRLCHEDVQIALNRHFVGDWGDLCVEDWQQNEQALTSGGRLFSVYHDRSRTKFYIITECDRSVTTVLLPEDY